MPLKQRFLKSVSYLPYIFPFLLILQYVVCEQAFTTIYTNIKGESCQMKDNLPEIIKIERLKQNLSVDELAKRAGVTRRAIFYWESGTKKMTIESADKVLNALGVSYILGKRKD